jgi:hypothetical protein
VGAVGGDLVDEGRSAQEDRVFVAGAGDKTPVLRFCGCVENLP